LIKYLEKKYGNLKEKVIIDGNGGVGNTTLFLSYVFGLVISIEIVKEHYEMIKNKQFDQAMTAMQSFVDDYPQSHYAANAHYWLGELYLLKRQFLFASKEFQQVLKDYPRSTKVAASMLKLGYAYAEMGNKPQAKKQFELVIQQFPDSSTAQLAKNKLTEISQS